jgi:lysozyme
LNQKKNIKKLSALLLVLLLLTGVLVFSNKRIRTIIAQKAYKTTWMKPFKRFFSSNSHVVKLPPGYDIYGIDISHHQKHIDWDKVSNSTLENKKLSFAIIKATEGKSWIDPLYQHNNKNLTKIASHKGVYHFFLPNSSPEAQAENYIKNVKLSKGDFPPIVDAEYIGKANPKVFRDNLKKMLDILEAHYKVKPIIYTMPGIHKGYFNGEFDNYPFWIAHYGVKSPRFDQKAWKIWQFTDKGRIEGIKTAVDLNVFCCDSIEFKKLLIQ